MKSRFVPLILFAVMVIGPLSTMGAKDNNRMKERLHQLFLWKVSDQLGLSSQEEAKFKKTYLALVDERARHNKNMKSVCGQMAKAKGSKAKALVKKYRQMLRDREKLQEKELDEVGKIIGQTRLAQYIVFKQKLTNRMTTMLGSEPHDKVKREPRVISE